MLQTAKDTIVNAVGTRAAGRSPSLAGCTFAGTVPAGHKQFSFAFKICWLHHGHKGSPSGSNNNSTMAEDDFKKKRKPNEESEPEDGGGDGADGAPSRTGSGRDTRMKVVVKSSKIKDPSIQQMQDTLQLVHGVTSWATIPDYMTRKLYSQLMRTSEDYRKLESKVQESKSRMVQAEKEYVKYKKELDARNYVIVQPPVDEKKRPLQELYRMVPNDILSLGSCEGGTYAHLSLGSMEKLYQIMAEMAEFTRDHQAKLFDFGAGLNIPGHHAAAKYCWYSVGVELDVTRSLEAARLGLRYLERGISRNHRVGLICADGLKLRPVEYGTHLFCFDLVFRPELYVAMMEWAARSKFKYVVTFKASREPSYLDRVKMILSGDVIAKVNGLKMSVSNEQCTAIVLRRRSVLESNSSDVPDWALGSGPLIDSRALMQPFVNGSEEETKACYRQLIRDLETRHELELPTRRYK